MRGIVDKAAKKCTDSSIPTIKLSEAKRQKCGPGRAVDLQAKRESCETQVKTTNYGQTTPYSVFAVP
jgi:hypothetical protein